MVVAAMAATLVAMAAVAVDAAHARTRATHKAAANQPNHACSKRRLRASSAHSRLTKMPNRQAMSLQASRLPASRQAATAATTAAVVAVVAAVALVVVVAADVRAAAVAGKAVPATSARSTVVKRLMPYER